LFRDGAKHEASDTSKTVNTNFDCHNFQ
jgi:hypothetical protein